MIRTKLLIASISAVGCMFAQSSAPTDLPSSSTPAATPAPAAPAVLSSPSMTGPIQQLPPAILDAGAFGKLSVNGILSGVGLWQGNHVSGADAGTGALSNGAIIIQKADGIVQFYLQAGAYDIPSLGTPFLSTENSVSNLFGPVPEAYIKFAGKNTSLEVGSLPTLIGAEYSFTFENMNIERGLLWNQEPAISKGIQLNQTMGKFSASLSWNDGFYSNRYTWLSGALTYTNGPHSLEFVAGGNYGHTAYQSFATPIQNNSSIYDLIYTYSKGAWIIQPYVQYTDVPTSPKAGIVKGASTTGGALLLSRSFGRGFSLAGRWEYISSSGNLADNSANLLYGPGSAATSLTVTPTFQTGGLFVRGDVGFVHATDIAPGSAFGRDGMTQNQPEAVIEMGFIFGDNIDEKH